MKNIICIKDSHATGLTIGKSYPIVKRVIGNHSNGMEYCGFLIMNDNNKRQYYSKRRFMTTDEYRDRQLNELV